MTTTEQDQTTAEKDTGRLEAFSDGVFSVAMTLLVVELKVPSLGASPSPKDLFYALGHQWPSYLAFATSFFTVLIMWVNHHGIFRLVRKTDALLLFSNGLLLFLVTAVPFPTALVASYLKTPAAHSACAVYSGLFVVICTAYGLLLMAASRNDRLLVPGARPEIRRRLRDCFFVGLPLYITACVAAPFSAWLSLGISFCLWIFWTISTMERCSSFERE